MPIKKLTRGSKMIRSIYGVSLIIGLTTSSLFASTYDCKFSIFTEKGGAAHTVSFFTQPSSGENINEIKLGFVEGKDMVAFLTESADTDYYPETLRLTLIRGTSPDDSLALFGSIPKAGGFIAMRPNADKSFRLECQPQGNDPSPARP